MAYTREVREMWLNTLTLEQHAKTCDYWFTIITYGSTPHTAFTKRDSLLQWLRERGLELTEPLADTGTWSCQKIRGEYREAGHLSYDEFYALSGEEIRVLSNGDYTLGIVTRDEDGIRTVHSLNPNCKHRKVFDYRESRGLQG